MWLAGPLGEYKPSSAPLPPVGVNYVFTESLGGCSVYIQGGQIKHSYSGTVPNGVAANEQVSEPYAGTQANFTQTCAVAYRTAGGWTVGTSVPHDVSLLNRTHAASGYKYLGY